MTPTAHAECYPHHVLKYCPKCGAAGFSPADRAHTCLSNPLYCRACSFTLYINAPASTVAIIHVTDDTLMMTIRRQEPMQGSLDLPGGFVNPRETAEDAVRREIREEFNLTLSKVTPYRKTYWNEYCHNGMVTFPLDLVFICEVADWTAFNSNEPDEVTRIDLKLADIPVNEIGLASIQRIVSDYRNDYTAKRAQENGATEV